MCDVRGITRDYFKAMRIPLLRGRIFTAEDRADDAVKKVIVNEAAVRTYWPNEDPIGKRITMPWGSDLKGEIIGVVGDVRVLKLDVAARTQIYWYLPQFPTSFMTYTVRTTSDPMAIVSAVRGRVAEVDADLQIARLRPMDEVLGESVRQERFTTLLLGMFAGLALLLAGVGLYGVISYSVMQRSREMGIRMALGARPGDVSRLVVREGMVLALAGVGTGLVAAFGLARFLASLLFGISSRDLVTFASVAGLLAGVALLATWIPARRATRVDPMVALRYE